MNIVNYALYLDVKEGSSVEELSRDYDLPPEYVREHVEAARLCFEQQIQCLDCGEVCASYGRRREACPERTFLPARGRSLPSLF